MPWVFFVPFILVTAFAAMNLVVGLIVNSMQDAHQTEEVEMTGVHHDQVLARPEAIDPKLDARDVKSWCPDGRQRLCQGLSIPLQPEKTMLEAI